MSQHIFTGKSYFTLFFLCTLFLTLGCEESKEVSGYCVSDRECSGGATCNPNSRRCTNESRPTARTDGALDRVLDMEIDAVVVDAMPIDTSVQDSMVPFDMTTPIDATPVVDAAHGSDA